MTPTHARRPAGRGAPVCRALVVSSLLLVPTVARGQVGQDSLGRAVPTDSTVRPGTGGSGDTARSDSAAPAALPTQAPTQTPAPTPTPAAVAVPGAPRDTTLARACAKTAPGALAPGLLAVVFRPGTTDKDRASAAKAVGGTVGGFTELGEVYVHVPVEAGPLQLVADRLIRQDPVTRVTPIPCPAPQPAAPQTAAPQTVPAQGAPAPGAQPPAVPAPAVPSPTDTGTAKPGDSASTGPRPTGLYQRRLN
jgi:hypothetical protein